MQAAMTLPSHQYNYMFEDVITHKMRRAKNEKIDAFLAIDVCILEIIISGRVMSALSVSILATSK